MYEHYGYHVNYKSTIMAVVAKVFYIVFFHTYIFFPDVYIESEIFS